MSAIIKTPISDKVNKKSGVTREDVLSTINSDSFPAIYVDDSAELSVSGGILKCGTLEVYLIEKTIIELVKILRDNGFNAFITDPKMSACPAILLNDFESKLITNIEADSSPLRLSEYHAKSSKNLVKLDELNIKREVLSIVDIEPAVDLHYSTDKRDELHYEIDGDLLYINNIHKSVVCLISYTVNKYFLFCSKENILNSYKIVDTYNKAEVNSIELFNLLKATNSNNKDVA